MKQIGKLVKQLAKRLWYLNYVGKRKTKLNLIYYVVCPLLWRLTFYFVQYLLSIYS